MDSWYHLFIFVSQFAWSYPHCSANYILISVALCDSVLHLCTNSPYVQADYCLLEGQRQWELLYEGFLKIL
jgi:hypothetical protein